MRAYHVPDATGLIKLDAMENPYVWPEALKQQWLAELNSVALNRYPDPHASTLRERLRSVMRIPQNIEIMFGNGSDELIQIIALALSGADRTFLAPEPTFVMYRMISQMVQTPFYGVPLHASDFSLDGMAMLQAIEQHQPAVIFIAHPNNPTGNLFDRNTLLDVIHAAPGLVIIDEAYHAFAGASFVDVLDDFDNLLVMRTFSKSGLAGLRLGYLLGHQSWLQEFEKIRLPYNINTLTQKSVEFILRHDTVLSDQAQQICTDRAELLRQLSGIKDIKTWPSAANFILFRVPEGGADRVHAGLKEQGVLIKNLHGQHPLLMDCLRVTVGKSEENTTFIAALKKVISAGY